MGSLDAMSTPQRPSREELDTAHELLERLAGEHGLSNLRHGARDGQVVADVAPGRTMFDVVAFEEAVSGRLGWRPDVISSGAPAAAGAGRPVGRTAPTQA